MVVEIVYESAAPTTDDEAGRLTGWRPGELSARGRAQARDLGQRWRGYGLAAVFCSDLARAVKTVQIAFADFRIPVHRDTRLRECDYGTLTGQPVAKLREHERKQVHEPFPGGQSYPQVILQTRDFLCDIAVAWRGRRILIVAHRATYWALEHLLAGRELTELAEGDAGEPRSSSYSLTRDSLPLAPERTSATQRGDAPLTYRGDHAGDVGP